MLFALEAEHKSFLVELREYLLRLRQSDSVDVDAVLKEHAEDMMSLREHGQSFVRQLGKDGWLGLGTPEEYGGQGRSFVHQWLFQEELKYQGLPTGQLLVQSIIPALVVLAPAHVREAYLPMCLSGELMPAIGYSEPAAGSDLAALQTRATKTDGGYILNGQKIWTTNGHRATHLWLAARTGAPDSRHKGITLFMLPMDTEGITVDAIMTQGDERTNSVFFEDVFVSDENRIGEENEGWSLIMAQLNFERTFYFSEMKHDFHALVDWWRDNQPEDPQERAAQYRELGRMAGEVELARLMCMRSAWIMDQGRVPEVEAAILKPFLTGTHQRTAVDALRLMGSWGQMRYGEEGAPANGLLERVYRATPPYTFGAGANELQRDILAARGLGLAR